MAHISALTLASDLWLRTQTDLAEGSEAPGLPPTFRTEVKAISKELDGGFNFGEVHGITSRVDSDAADFIQGLLASHLLANSTFTATIIESTPFFDVRKLYHALFAVLSNSEEAMAALARLKISKVFDYQGMTEALAELHGNVPNIVSKAGVNVEKTHIPPKATIEDSEDEEDLLKAPTPVVTPVAPDGDQEPRLLLIVNSVSHVVGPAIQNNYVKGQAMLSILMRSISSLTYTNSMCTFVFGSARSIPEEETLSILKTANFRPTVGIGFGYLVDVHLYLHQMLLRKPSQGRAGAMTTLLTVVHDKTGNRFGRSAVFSYSPAGILQDVC